MQGQLLNKWLLTNDLVYFEDGYNNISNWIENAAEQAGR